MRVLIADDNDANRKRLRATLAADGHDTEEATDGVEALEKLRTGSFDAVISDVLMPRMDGYRLSYEVRSSEELRDTRIIVYSSTYTSLAARRLALTAGADRFIRKPLEAEVILRALKDVTSARRPPAEAVAPATELAVVKEYSEVLVRRLEDTNLKLVASRRRLARANAKLRKSERWVRLLLDSTAEGIYGLNLEGSFTFCNAAALAMLGYAGVGELLGRNAHDLIHHTRADGESYPMDESGVFLAIREDRGSHTEDGIFWRADGTSFSAESWSYPVRKDGTLVGAVVTFVDITERKRAQEALKASEKRFRSLIENSRDIVAIVEPEGTIRYVNPSVEGALGFRPEDLVGKDAFLLVPPEDASLLKSRMAERTAAETPVAPISFRLRHRDGSWRNFEAAGSRRAADEGREGIVLTFRDVTRRLNAEAALRESEARQRAVFDTALDALVTMDHEGRVAEFNPAAERLFQYSREEVLGKTMADLIIPPSVRESHRRGLARYNTTGEAVILGRRIEVSAMRRDGTEFPAELAITRINQEGPAFFTGQIRDLTEQKRVVTEMLRSEERFRRLFDSNTIGIAIADLTGNTVEANDAYLNMLGFTREELLAGKVNWSELTPAEQRGRDQVAVEELQRTGIASPWEKEFLRRDGSRVPVLIGVAMLKASEGSVIAYVVDLTERRRLEGQFLQAQKMEAVGQLAGGVAHDFNNLLTVILGYSELLAAKLDPGSLAFGELDEIRAAGERAASLTRQLLAFSRQQVLERRVLDVNDLIANTEKMLRRLIGEDIELVTVLSPALRRVFADAGQLEQVIMNLAVNARDAMPRGGRLTIESANVELDDAYVLLHTTVRPGSYVMIAVSDTGAGMSGETLRHMFEPFFTTKERGKGTGLGLATVYGIVKQSGGSVWVYSEVGKGTAFKIYLPLVEEVGEAEPVPAAEPVSLVGSETLLLVEDEKSVRALSRSILESYGYTVLVAESGREGLEVAREYPLPIHLLVTDVVMPDMGGSDLASRLSALRPGVCVLYMSGYTDDAVFRHGVLEKGRVFLQKPFTPETLARKVREALGG
jgi:two-component system, cell cycle sensor histidine kinase and response regulator CckA